MLISNSFNALPKNRIVCIIFVLLEVAVLSLLFYLIILPIYEDSLFDRTLKLRGLRHVLKENEGNDMAKCMRGVGGGLWILLFQVSRHFFFLPFFCVRVFPLNSVVSKAELPFPFLLGAWFSRMCWTLGCVISNKVTQKTQPRNVHIFFQGLRVTEQQESQQPIKY